MGAFVGYRCSVCGAEYDRSDPYLYNCPVEGGNLDVVLDYEEIRQKYSPTDFSQPKEPSLWRYLPLLPVSDPGGHETPLRAAGYTPTFYLPPLARKLGLAHLWVKDESRNPTGSFKDRASSVVIARSQEIEADIIITASSGNAGAALAGMAAPVGKQTIILVPKTAPPAKIAQLLVYGAQVVLVDGTYDDAFDLSLQGTVHFGWYSRNTGFNPFTTEGKKTGALEIWEWREKMKEKRPTLRNKKLSVFVSVGDGNIITGLHKGFRDLEALGWLEGCPRIFGVQAFGASAIAQAFDRGDEKILPTKAETLADSISVGLPRDGLRGLRAATQTGGAYLTVTDREILEAIQELGRAGVFAEPAGAAACAGLVKAAKKDMLSADDPVVVINTGNGLKDVRAAVKAVGEAPIIEPTLSALERTIHRALHK